MDTNRTGTTLERMLLRPDEAAFTLNVGRSTLFELLATGEIRSIKHGRNRLIPVESLRAWITRQLEESAA